MQLQKLGLIGSLALLVTACAGTNKPGSVSGGECRVFERPPYVVFGQTGYDQNWIDGNVEAGVAACKWQRPAARPESLRQPTVAGKIIKRKKLPLRKRIRERIWPSKVEPVVPVPPIPERPPVIAEPPEIIIIPRANPADDLLDVPSSPVQPTPPPKKKRWFNR